MKEVVVYDFDGTLTKSDSLLDFIRYVHGCVLATQAALAHDRLTGRSLSPNCYGSEKVRRLLQRFPDRQQYRLTAYGDSRGDREMLAFADEAHYKPFRV